RLEGGVGQTFARAVGRDEVFEHAQSLAEVGENRALDDFAGRLGHQAAHAGQLANLLLRATGFAVHHHEDGIQFGPAVVVFHGGVHDVGNLVRRVRPDVDDLVVALAVGDDAAAVLFLDFADVVMRLANHHGFLPRHDHVVDADGNA